MKIKFVGSVWFRALLSSTILLVLTRQIDLQKAGSAFLDADNLYLIPALALDISARIVMILRWFLLLRASHVPITISSTTRLFLTSAFIGSALPTGGADAARAYGLAQHTANPQDSIASVAVDRLLGVLALLGLGMTGIFIWTQQTEVDLDYLNLILVFTFVLMATLISAFWIERLLRLTLPNHWQRSQLATSILEIGDAVGRYRGRMGTIAIVFTLSLVVQLFRVLEVYCLGEGLGIGVKFTYYLLFMPIGLLVFMLPLSIAGLGLPQGAIVWLLRPVGVPDERSFALSTLFIVMGLIGSLPGLWLYLRSRRT